MRILYLDKKGIEDVIDEKLNSLPLNQRLERANEDGTFSVNYKIKVLPKIASYFQNQDKITRIINLVGPVEDVPSFVIATDKNEYKEIKEKSKNDHWQNQLVVLDKGIFYRDLKLWSYTKKIKIVNMEEIFLNNRGRYGTKEYHSLIFGHLIDDMVKYFLNHYKYNTIRDSKIVFGSERAKEQIIKSLDKLSVKKIN